MASRNAPRWIGLAAVVLAGVWLAQRRGVELPAPSAGPGVESPLPSESASIPPTPGPARPSGAFTPSAPPAPDRPDLVLKLGQLRDGGTLPRLAAPLRALVRIDAELDQSSPATDYSVVLSTAEGRAVWRGFGRRQPGTNVVTVVMGGEALRPGDFILSVAAPGRPAEASEYPFAVRAR